MSCNNTSETPIMVLKFRPVENFVLFLGFLLACVFFYAIITSIITSIPEDRFEEFLQNVSMAFFGLIMILIGRVVNIKQIEVYNDKIVKLPVIPLPVIGRKVCIELDKAYYKKDGFGIQLGYPKFILNTSLFHYLLGWPVIYIPSILLTDEFIAFLSKISGRPDSEFRGLTSFQQRKLIESKTYTKED